jgi:hypothetical protein
VHLYDHDVEIRSLELARNIFVRLGRPGQKAALRVSGMTATLETRALQVAQSQMDFIEAFSALVQDELDRRRSRLIDRRFALSGLLERKNPKDFDWPYNPKIPKREVLELAALKFNSFAGTASSLSPAS